ncbi:uncharacterized protein [Dermacentor albipictus]|uniref:uncharacterized protein isoform X2 n=1 Tax=Dermacentor albipictus TaxID=60249 RepID=UPI0031FC3F69
MISPPRGRFLLHVVVVVLVPSPGNGQLHPKNPTIYKMVSLNQNCGTRFGNGSLNNATEPLSSAIVTATQFRDRRAATTDGCSTEIGASSSESMIVSLVEMNLRQGLLNDSCIDYVNIITRFTSANDPDQQCGRIRESENKAFSTSYTLSIKLFSRTPLSYFFDGNILAVVVTAANELMPQSSLLLISFGVINLIITWLSVFYCCVKSALSRKKALRDDRFGSATPPMGTGSVSGGDGATAQDVSADDDGSPDMMTSGPLRSEGASRAGGSSIRDPLVASVKKRDRDDTSSVGAN